MNQIDTLNIEIATLPIISNHKSPPDAIFSYQGMIYFKLKDAVCISAKSIIEFLKNDNFTFTPEWVTFPTSYESKGDCIICNCYTNTGFRLLNSEELLCNACLNRTVTEALDWIREHPEKSFVDLL